MVASEAKKATLWVYGVNQELEVSYLQSQIPLWASKAMSRFRADFHSFSRHCNIVPHTALAKPHVPQPSEVQVREGTTPDGEAEEGEPEQPTEPPELVVQSVLLDKATMQVFRYVLPHAVHLKVLRFSGCHLDVEQLALLKEGLSLETKDTITVSTLAIDWNPVEVPVTAEVQNMTTEEELDKVEKEREALEVRRSLLAFKDTLTARTNGDLQTALSLVATTAFPEQQVVTMEMPLDVGTWALSMTSALGIPYEAGQQVFQLLDQGASGFGDGLVPLSRLQDTFQELLDSPDSEELREATERAASALASFVDDKSPVEVASFRHCSIGRVEALAFAQALKSSAHLRSLTLWGNRICDQGARALAEALEANWCLQFLGLGRNNITNDGLAALCGILGFSYLTDKQEAEPYMKTWKAQEKENSDPKKKKAAPPAPKKDANERERYTPSQRLDKCEELKEGGSTAWLLYRNQVLKVLVLEHNPITDAAKVEELQPFGVGDLVLRGTPCAEKLLKTRPRKEPGEGPPAPPGIESAKMQEKIPACIKPLLRGWRLVL